MNFSTINSAQKELSKFENDYHELAGKVNLHLVSLAETTFSSEEKNKTWQALLNYSKSIISQVEKILGGLENVRFSQEESVLEEEKTNLIERFKALLNDLNKEKMTILRQIENKKTFLSPLRQKHLNEGYCYFCDIDIADSFSYKLEEKNKRILGVEVNEKARFCSQECLLSYCSEYKKREEVRQSEEKKIKNNIENNKKIVSEIQGKMTGLTNELNQLSRRERELELNFDNFSIPKRGEEVGFFKRFAQALGLAKKSENVPLIEKVRRRKIEVREQLKISEEDLKKALVLLSISKQVEEERRGTEKKLLQQEERISESEQEDI